MIGAGTFAQTVDYSLIPYRKGDKWGYSDPARTIIITPKYDDAQFFSQGYAAVKVGNKWGYINMAGKMVIPAKYTVAKSFRKGYIPNNKEGGDSILFAGASVRADGYEQCITTRGVVLPKCPAMSDNAVPENTIPIEAITREKTYSVPDNNGLFDKIIDDYKIPGNDETYYIAQKNGMYGVFNSKFETIVPFEYSAVKKFHAGDKEYLEVQKNGMNGIFTSDGRQDIAPEYSDITLVKGDNKTDYAILKKDGKSYVKDLSNNDIVSLGYSNITYDNTGGFVVTDNNNNRGFYYPDKRMIAPKYSDLKGVDPGSKYLRVTTSNGKAGYINSSGDEFFSE